MAFQWLIGTTSRPSKSWCSRTAADPTGPRVSGRTRPRFDRCTHDGTTSRRSGAASIRRACSRMFIRIECSGLSGPPGGQAMNDLGLLVIGTGEYVTGFVDGAPSASDKSAGVVALVAFDL